MSKKVARYLVAITVFSIAIGSFLKGREEGKHEIGMSEKNEQSQSLHSSIVNASDSAVSAEMFAQEMENIFLNQLESQYQIDMGDVAISEYIAQFGGEALSAASYDSEKRYYQHIYDAVQLVKAGEDTDIVYQGLVASYGKVPKKAWRDIVDVLNPELEKSIREHATRTYEMYVTDLVASTRPLYRLDIIAKEVCADKELTGKLAEEDHIQIQSNYQECKLFANKEIIQQIVSVPIEVPEILMGWEAKLDPLKIKTTVSMRIK